MDPEFYMYLAATLFFVAGVSYLSAAQRGLRGLGRTRAAVLAEEEPRHESALRAWSAGPNRILASIAVAVVIWTITAAYLAAAAALEAASALGAAPGIMLAAAAVIMVLLLAVFGVLVPRSLVISNPERTALRLIGSIYLLHLALWPVSQAALVISRFISRLLGAPTPNGEGLFGPETEFKGLVPAGTAEPQTDEDEQERDMVHSIFEFGDTVVREVMVPRPDMKVIPEQATLEEALEVMVGGGFSRVPMYRDDLDNIVGIVYAKDLLRYVGKGRSELSLVDLARAAYFVPETKKIDELLRELQKKKIHLAIVVDEYGGTAGLITIEDLLEEIVGEIFDEYDLEEALVEPIDQQTMRLDARYPYDDLSDLLQVDFPEDDDIDTVGGFVFSLIGRAPEAGERVEYGPLTFTVEKILGRRIRKVLVKRHANGVRGDGEGG